MPKLIQDGVVIMHPHHHHQHQHLRSSSTHYILDDSDYYTQTTNKINQQSSHLIVKHLDSNNSKYAYNNNTQFNFEYATKPNHGIDVINPYNMQTQRVRSNSRSKSHRDETKPQYNSQREEYSQQHANRRSRDNEAYFKTLKYLDSY